MSTRHFLCPSSSLNLVSLCCLFSFLISLPPSTLWAFWEKGLSFFFTLLCSSQHLIHGKYVHIELLNEWIDSWMKIILLYENLNNVLSLHFCKKKKMRPLTYFYRHFSTIHWRLVSKYYNILVHRLFVIWLGKERDGWQYVKALKFLKTKKITRRALLEARCKPRVGWMKNDNSGGYSWRVRHQLMFKAGRWRTQQRGGRWALQSMRNKSWNRASHHD